MAHPLRFRHEVIDADPPGSQHDITLIADVNGNGRPDFVAGREGRGKELYWFENPEDPTSSAGKMTRRCSCI